MELTASDARAIGSRLAVLSPHLDDGVLSLGAAISLWSASGVDVSIVTVLAGTPESTLPTRPWDAAYGFATAGEASRTRRDEDRAACAMVGARPVWLPYGDAREDRGGDDETIWNAIVAAVDGADAVLVPGFPLAHPDHAWLARLVLAREPLATRVGLYVEQPYAYDAVVGLRLLTARNLTRLGLTALRTRRARERQTPHVPDATRGAAGDGRAWVAVTADRQARRAKRRALSAYRSQVPRLGRWLPARMALYDACWGGEGLAWIDMLDAGDATGASIASTLSG